MMKIVLTKKLNAAIQVLSGERMADSSDEAFVVALRKGNITVEQIYKIMATMKYQWSHKRGKRGYWIWKPLHLRSVQHLFAIVNKEDEPIMKRMMEER